MVSLQDKIDVNGSTAHPLYQFMRQQQPKSSPGMPLPVPGGGPGAIEWNYTKFLINREGQAVQRYKPGFDPLNFEGDVSVPGLQPACWSSHNGMVHEHATASTVMTALAEVLSNKCLQVTYSDQ